MILRKNWYSIKKYYEYPLRSQQVLSFQIMTWLVDQIIESRYSEIFFPLLSHQSLHIELSNNWYERGNLPKITIYPKWKWLTLHYCMYSETSNYKFDEYKITFDEVDSLRNILFMLLNRLEESLNSKNGCENLDDF